MLSFVNGQFLVNGNLIGQADTSFAIFWLIVLAVVWIGPFVVVSSVTGFLNTALHFLFNDTEEEIIQDTQYVQQRGFVTKFLKGLGSAIVDLIIKPVFYVGWALMAGFIAIAGACGRLGMKLGEWAMILIEGFFGILGKGFNWAGNMAWAGLSWVGRGLYRVASLPVNFVLDMIGNWATSDLTAETVEEEVEEEVESSGYTWYQRLAAHILEMDRDLRNQNRNENADRIIAAVEDNNMDIHDLAAAYTDLTSAVINSDSVYDDSSDEIVNGLFTALMNDDVENTEPSVEHIDEIPVGLPVVVEADVLDETVEMVDAPVFVEVVPQEAVEMIGAIGTLEELVLRATDSMKIEDLAEQGNRRREVQEMTRKQLRAECKRLHLPVSGNKATLQERILQAS